MILKLKINDKEITYSPTLKECFDFIESEAYNLEWAYEMIYEMVIISDNHFAGEFESIFRYSKDIPLDVLIQLILSFDVDTIEEYIEEYKLEEFKDYIRDRLKDDYDEDDY